jgi:hypothetical protein
MCLQLFIPLELLPSITTLPWEPRYPDENVGVQASTLLSLCHCIIGKDWPKHAASERSPSFRIKPKDVKQEHSDHAVEPEGACSRILCDVRVPSSPVWKINDALVDVLMDTNASKIIRDYRKHQMWLTK